MIGNSIDLFRKSPYPTSSFTKFLGLFGGGVW
jgi:hypothetical protein